MLSNIFSCQILIKLEFSGLILEKNPKMSNFMKIRSAGFELFDVDRQM